MERVTAALQDDSSGANPSSVKSDDSSPRPEGGRGSPPPNCAICLGTCRNKSFTDSCLHQFCFKCLLTWSKVKAECPLCKQNFRSIIHNVRSNDQYEEYMVEQRHTEEATERIDIDNLTTATRRFRYRTTLTLPRRESIAIQQLLMHYPLVADVFPPHAAPLPPVRPPPARRRRSPAAFRRTVYRHNLWARPLPDFTGRFRDCTPEFYRYNDTQMHRLVPWINRELHYLLNENIGHISYVLTRILELLPQYHINSPEFREALQRYFGDRTEHFLHELYCFASTPYDMTGYDRNIQYTTDTRISTMINEVISSSESEWSVDSDIVMVSSSEPAEPPPGPSRLPAPVYPQNYIPQPVNNVIPIETISHSDTDDDDEVMVVGYIKPPQDRTPEVVDLLGSDSDVIVQDTPQETEVPAQPASLVKFSLRQHGSWPYPDSDSSEEYRPPARRRRPRSDTATTTDTSASTPTARTGWNSPTDTPDCSPPRTHDRAPEPDHTDTDDCTSSDSERRKRPPKKKRKKTRETREKDKARSETRSRHRERETTPNAEERDKRSKRKSYSGKGVKSSKRSEAVAAPSEPTAGLSGQPDQAGTSRASDPKATTCPSVATSDATGPSKERHPHRHLPPATVSSSGATDLRAGVGSTGAVPKTETASCETVDPRTMRSPKRRDRRSRSRQDRRNHSKEDRRTQSRDQRHSPGKDRRSSSRETSHSQSREESRSTSREDRCPPGREVRRNPSREGHRSSSREKGRSSSREACSSTSRHIRRNYSNEHQYRSNHRANRTLRSVVNMINSGGVSSEWNPNRNSPSSGSNLNPNSSSGSKRTRRSDASPVRVKLSPPASRYTDDDSDSEDNLPLNLTVHK